MEFIKSGTFNSVANEEKITNFDGKLEEINENGDIVLTNLYTRSDFWLNRFEEALLPLKTDTFDLIILRWMILNQVNMHLNNGNKKYNGKGV